MSPSVGREGIWPQAVAKAGGRPGCWRRAQESHGGNLTIRARDGANPPGRRPAAPGESLVLVEGPASRQGFGCYRSQAMSLWLVSRQEA